MYDAEGVAVADGVDHLGEALLGFLLGVVFYLDDSVEELSSAAERGLIVSIGSIDYDERATLISSYHR